MHIVLFCSETGETWRKQHQALLAAIRREPNPGEVASLHSAGLTETAVEFVKQQSAFVHKVILQLPKAVQTFLYNSVLLTGLK